MKANAKRLLPYDRRLFHNDTSDSQEPFYLSTGEMSPCTPTDMVHAFKTPDVCPPTPIKTPSTQKKSMKRKSSASLLDTSSIAHNNHHHHHIHMGTPMISRASTTNDENHVNQLLRSNKIKRVVSVVAPSPAPKRMCNSAQRPLFHSTATVGVASTNSMMHHYQQQQQHNNNNSMDASVAIGVGGAFLSAPKVQQHMNPSATPFKLVNEGAGAGVKPDRVFRSLQFEDEDDNDGDDDDDVVEEEFEDGFPSSTVKSNSYQFSSVPRSTSSKQHSRRSTSPVNIKAVNLFGNNDDDNTMQDEEESQVGMMEDDEPSSPLLGATPPRETASAMRGHHRSNSNNNSMLGIAASPLLSNHRRQSHEAFVASTATTTTTAPQSPDLFNQDYYTSDEELLSDGENEMEPYIFDAASQSQMPGCTPPRISQSCNFSSPTNVTRIPCRLTTEAVHENPFSPERNIKPKARRSIRMDDIDILSDAVPTRPSAEETANANTSQQGENFILAFFSRYKEDFDEMATLGDGSFGKVTKVKHRLDGICYAVKQTKRRIKGEKDKKAILKEVQALATLVDNQHIVRYFSAWLEDDRLFVQTELCEGGTWAQQITAQTYFREEQLINILRQLATGLQQMHTQNIVHLDIKPENIYLSDVGLYKVGDLGLAASSLQEIIDVNEGDSRYLARELLNGQSDDNQLTKVDIFALGASLYEAAIRRPLPNNGDEWHEIRNGLLKHFDASDYSEEFISLVKSMLDPDPKRRPSAYDILQHKLVLRSKMSYEELEKKYYALEELLRKQKETEEALRRSLAQLSMPQ